VEDLGTERLRATVVAKKKGRPPIDLREKLLGIPSHTEPLSRESQSPIRHYRRAVITNFTLIDYIENHISEGS
jgi:hypothetical protein